MECPQATEGVPKGPTNLQLIIIGQQHYYKDRDLASSRMHLDC